MVGTAGRRLDLCFSFSFEVISFYSIFHVICFLKTGGGLSSRREEDQKMFCSQGPNKPFAHMTPFYYYDQNPSGFCFLVQIRASLLFRYSKTGYKKTHHLFCNFAAKRVE